MISENTSNRAWFPKLAARAAGLAALSCSLVFVGGPDRVNAVSGGAALPIDPAAAHLQVRYGLTEIEATRRLSLQMPAAALQAQLEN